MGPAATGGVGYPSSSAGGAPAGSRFALNSVPGTSRSSGVISTAFTGPVKQSMTAAVSSLHAMEPATGPEAPAWVTNTFAGVISVSGVESVTTNGPSSGISGAPFGPLNVIGTGAPTPTCAGIEVASGIAMLWNLAGVEPNGFKVAT